MTTILIIAAVVLAIAGAAIRICQATGEGGYEDSHANR
jgi:hypothetical protein